MPRTAGARPLALAAARRLPLACLHAEKRVVEAKEGSSNQSRRLRLRLADGVYVATVLGGSALAQKFDEVQEGSFIQINQFIVQATGPNKRCGLVAEVEPGCRLCCGLPPPLPRYLSQACVTP
jgi:hypothetical protein